MRKNIVHNYLGNCWAWNGFVYGYFVFANFALIYFYNIFSWPLIAKPQNIITLRKSWSVAHWKATYDNRSIKQKALRVYFVNWTQINYNVDFRFHTYNMFALFTIIKKVLFIKMVIEYFLPRILIYIQCYHN